MGIKEMEAAFKAMEGASEMEGVEFVYPVRPDEMKGFLTRFASWLEDHPESKWALTWDSNNLRVRISY